MHFEREEKSSPQVGPAEGFPHRDAEAVLAIVRADLLMDAYAVLLQACQRQDGVTKQKNASNYF